MATQKVKLNIEGMHCGSCAMGIQMLLQNTEGVSNCSASWEGKNAEVEFDDEKVKIEDITKAIADLGYKGTPTE